MTIDEFAFKGCLETALNLGLIVCGINIVTLDLINLEVDSVQSKVLYLSFKKSKKQCTKPTFSAFRKTR